MPQPSAHTAGLALAVILVRRALRRQIHPVSGQVIALCLVAVASFARYAFDAHLGMDIPFATFFPAVLLAAVVGGGWAGTTALVASCLVAAYFWVEPRGAIAVTPPALARMGIFLFTGGLLVLTAVALRDMARAAVAAEDRADLIAREMHHRVGNILMLVSVIVRQTAAGASSIADFKTSFEARIGAFVEAQKLAMTTQEEPLDLRRLLEQATKPFDTSRFVLSGPPVELPATVVERLYLLLHEFATNASKYGALSVPSGLVELSWSVDDGAVDLVWKERGGPSIVAPVRRGFGTRLSNSALPPDLGETRVYFDEDGVRCLIRLLCRNAA